MFVIKLVFNKIIFKILFFINNDETLVSRLFDNTYQVRQP